MEDLRVDDGYHDLFVAHQARLLRVAYGLTGDLDVAHDAVAEAFSRAYPTWRAGGVRDAPAFLAVCVVNECRERYRRAARRRVRSASMLLPAQREAFEDAAVDRRDLVAALRSLPPGQRRCVVLRYVGDFTETETASVLGVSVGTIKSQVARALVALRAALVAEEVSE